MSEEQKRDRILVVEDDDVVRERETKLAALRQDRLLMPRTEGRPDKHTRRKLRAEGRENTKEHRPDNW